MTGIKTLLAVGIVVIAHRGEHLKHPENTIEAIRGAIEAHADYVELDIRTTKDGRLVLMHDETVDRTTGGHGKVRDLSLKEIRKLKAGGVAHVPTFDEALQEVRGKISVYVDTKDISPTDLVAALRRHGMVRGVVVYGSADYLKEVLDLEPDVTAMPEADSPEAVESNSSKMKVDVFAFDSDDFNESTIEAAKKNGAKIFVDRLDAFDTPQAWQDAIDRGAAGIQSNHPDELVKYLRLRGLHQ